MLFALWVAAATQHRQRGRTNIVMKFTLLFLLFLLLLLLLLFLLLLVLLVLLPFGSAQSSGRRMWAANRNVGAAAATALCGDDDDGNGVATVARILRAPNCAVAMCWRLCVCA